MPRIEGAINHWSAGPSTQTVEQIRAFHMNVRGYRDIAYNWIILHPDSLGYVPEHWGKLVKIGRRVNDDLFLAGDEIPAAHAPYNSRYIAIVTIGGPGYHLHPLQEEAWIQTNLTLKRRHKYPLTKIGGHGEYNPTACPGPEITKLIKEIRAGKFGGVE